MSGLDIGLLSLVVLLVLLALRVPIGFALIGVSAVGIALIRNLGVATSQLKTEPFDFASHWSFSAIPMFILMGALVHHSGIAASIFNAARMWTGNVPGGLAVSANFACAGFSAASGSSLATAAAMGRIAIPEMKAAGYDMRLATGVVASAGTLGVMIPPSITFILYGIFAEVSVSKLFVAGILPGLLTALVYAAMIMIRCRINPEIAPPLRQSAGWLQRFRALSDVWPLLVLILAIVGGMYSGLVTATEAGALGAFVAMILVFLKGKLTIDTLKASILETIITTASIFWVAIGAILLTRLLAMSGAGTFLTDAIGNWSTSEAHLIIAAAVIFIFLGMFLDPLGVILISLPILLPMFRASGVDMIWFGVVVVKFIEVGLLTPPVGMNVYVIKSVTDDDVTLPIIFRGVAWFLLCEVIVIGLLIGFPAIATFLPNLM
nr:TRAP transporter large permease [Flavimaribacter sediminis]